MGMKAELKKFLKEKGVSKISTPTGELRLGNAKTVDLFKAAHKLGF